MSVTLPASSGSVESLNVCDSHGCTPYSLHTFDTVPCAIPTRAASGRELQCVTPYAGR